MGKRLLFVIDSLNSGGAERSLVSLLNVFPKSRYEVDLYLVSKSGLYLSLIPDHIKIKQVEFKEKNFIVSVHRIAFSIYLRVMKVLTYFSIQDKLHGAQRNWLFNKNSYKSIKKEYAAAFAYSQGFPTYFVSTKVIAKRKYAWINTDYQKALYNYSFDERYYADFDVINIVTEEASEVFKSVFPQFSPKLTVIRDIISTDMVLRMSEDRMDREVLTFSSKIKIITVGRLVEVKGFDMAIEAASILKKKGFEFIWIVIGEGPLENELKDNVKKHDLEGYFQFIGAFLNPFPIIKKCDIYCQTSRFEGYGMAIAEAKILNKPIVSTNFKVVYNQLEDYVNGLIVDMSGEAIAEGVAKLINNKDLRDVIISNLKKESKGTEREIEKVFNLIDTL